MTDQPLKTALDRLLTALQARDAAWTLAEPQTPPQAAPSPGNGHLAECPPWTEGQAMLLRRLMEVCEAGGISVLCGGRGTGKTSMAREALRRMGRGTYELAQDYVEETAALVQCRLSGQRLDEARARRNLRVQTRVMILDEAYHSLLDPIGSRVLEDLVIRRHDIRKPTVMICNAGRDNLPLPDSIVDRIKDGGRIFHPRWDSFRRDA